MSNWAIIDEAAVRRAGLSEFLEAMQKRAAAKGEDDPLPGMIADVTAAIRAAVSVGNDIDTDTTKIPNSLTGLALRMIMRRIKAYLEYPLIQDERDQATEDRSYLIRISDNKISFEAPDTAGGDSAMQGLETIEAFVSPAVANRCTLGGLL